jgi:acetyltransferase
MQLKSSSEASGFTVRPMRAEDRARYGEFLARIDPRELGFRFGARDLDVPPSSSHGRFTLMVNTGRHSSRLERSTRRHGRSSVTFERAWIRTLTARAEFAILARSDLQGRGLGRVLLQNLSDDRGPGRGRERTVADRRTPEIARSA